VCGNITVGTKHGTITGNIWATSGQRVFNNGVQTATNNEPANKESQPATNIA